MENLILNTKLHAPPARPNLVVRPHLVQKLNMGLTRPLTLISAPPGFGKTTLMTTWLEQQPLPAAWYSLDESDNDLARFLSYLVAALETVQAGAGHQTLHRLQGRRRPSLESLMTLLSNDIAAISHDFVLVLDDYHLIELQAIHEGLAFLLDHLPPPMHLVIATRADPPLPLTRLRARGQLVEVRGPELRFSPGETAAFLNEREGLNLTPEQIAALDARAEGWIAGLQLAAIAMQSHNSTQETSDISGFIAAFTGSHRFILDYLAEEVLQRQTPAMQDFLLQTSILDQMNASLCDAITGRNDSAQVLAQMDRTNLFLIPLDEARQWYRYHHLFDDLLQSRLQQSPGVSVPDLHLRASIWYEQHSLANQAVDHALAACDFDRAARLIEQASLSLLLRSEFATLLNWIIRLPDDSIQKRPLLCLTHAAALMNAGKIDQAAARLALVDDAQLDPQGRAMAALLRPAIALLRADTPNALTAARRAMEEAETLFTPPTNPQGEAKAVVSLYMTIILAELQIAAGQLRAAAASCRRGLDFGNSFSLASQWEMILGFMDYELSELYYEWNELDASKEHALQSLEICRAGRNEEIESYTLVVLAQVKQAQGDSLTASDLIRQAMQLGRKRNVANEMRYVAARQARVLIAQGRIEDAARLVNELPAEEQPIWFIERGLAPIARARVLIAEHRFSEAAQLLEYLKPQMEAAGQMGMLIEILALLALARHGQKDERAAATALETALSLAEPEGYIRTFLDLGDEMRLMISNLTQGELSQSRVETNGNNHPLAAYIERLLAAFPVALLETAESSHPTSLKTQTLPDPLSDRELEVLRLMAEGWSNQEIANRLVVAVSTVKTHVNNIFSKLDAGNRTQAVARAREHKLL